MGVRELLHLRAADAQELLPALLAQPEAKGMRQDAGKASGEAEMGCE